MYHQEHLLYQITHRIRQSLDLKEILDATVDEIRAFLAVDRAKIYRFDADGSGEVVAEAVDLARLPALKHLHFPAQDVPLDARERFVQLRQRVIVDVTLQQKSLGDGHSTDWLAESAYQSVDPCHVDYLQAMGVVASLVMPILHQGELWGLLAIHHSQARHFSRRELVILRFIAEQLEIAIAQAALLSQARQQARQEAIVNQVSQLLHSPLDLRDILHRVLQTTVDALNGSGGRLYLTADPMTRQDALFVVGEQPHGVLEAIPAWLALLGCDLSAQATNDSAAAVDVLDPSSQAAPTEDIPPWQQLTPPIVLNVADFQEHSEWFSLAAAFQDSPIRTLLVTRLRFQQECLGYLVVFRNGYDEEIDWAGQRSEDSRNEKPRISFQVWRELRRNQTPTWSASDCRLMKSITLHLYMVNLQQRLTAKLRYQAYHDALTNLANRLLFTEQLTLALMQADQNQALMAVGFLDLDRFKAVNDSLGHQIGDELLEIMARRLTRSLHTGDQVARWGGDEFTLILPSLQDGAAAIARATQILESLSHPIHLRGQELVITASLGMALFPYDGDTVETLLRKADAALNQAKQQGKNTFHLYRKECDHDGLTRLVLESELRKAIDNEELRLWFQPQVHIPTGQLIGVEALVRWQHPRFGLISPGRFIPLAEETGLIKPLGRWALQTACAAHRHWCAAGLPPLRVAVNLSAIQLNDEKLLPIVQQALQQYDVAPHYLELEITETTAMQNVDATLGILNHLRRWGVAVAIDDFGMGYSSLNTLKYFPVQTLKIDKSFVQDAVEDPSDAAIAKAIVALGKGLTLAVLAEGVETEAQLQFLYAIGCDYAQGYLFGAPMPMEDLQNLLQQKTQRVQERLYLTHWQAA